MKKTFFESICAGILISIGGCVYLACDNKYVGATFFTVALLCICYKGYYLFTGKIGYIAESHKKDDIQNVITGLIVNLITTFLIGMLIRFAMPALGENANVICNGKLSSQIFIQTFIRGIFCGFLMYLAVSTYKEKDTPFGIIFCVPVFILSGFEHSIADMFYFGASGIFSVKVLLFMVAVVAGNTVGGLTLPILKKAGEKFEKQ